MLPVIELPRLDYADMKQVTLADIVATNVSAYEFVAGPTSPPDPNAALTTKCRSTKDGNELFSGDRRPMRSATRCNSYAWTVQQDPRRSDTNLKPGMIVITGALGRVTDAEPGAYVAHYGPLGELKFRIEGNDDALQAARQ